MLLLCWPLEPDRFSIWSDYLELKQSVHGLAVADSVCPVSVWSLLIAWSHFDYLMQYKWLNLSNGSWLFQISLHCTIQKLEQKTKTESACPGVFTVTDLGLSKSTVQQAWGLKHSFCGLSETTWAANFTGQKFPFHSKNVFCFTTSRVFLYASKYVGKGTWKTWKITCS